MDISIVIPCYNAERYLAQTVGSVLDQTQSAHQIIIVDDGSTDSSLAIARKFEAATDGLVQVHSERSASAARTRNLGAAFATGDALMFLDADDVLAPDALEALSKALMEQRGAVAACPWRRLEQKGGQWLSRPASCALRRPDQDALMAWLTGWYYPPCSVLWSRDAFFRTGGWDEDATVNDDGDLMMRALAMGMPLVEAERGAAYYRKLPQGETSLSSTQRTYGGLAGRLATIEKIARMLEENGRIGPYRRFIGQAFGLIAADAAGQYAGLCQQAKQRRGYYMPRGLPGVSARLDRFRKGSGTIPMALPPRDQVEEITFGIQRAEQSLLGAGGGTETGSDRPRLLAASPTVSVIIPVFNRAHVLKRTLDGVLKQTFTDFEVLVVDDCSKDDPESVVASFQDSRLRYLRQPVNKGVSAARNRGLREARGPFVAFLDDDDEWFPEKLALQVALFRRSPPDVGLIYTGVETVSDDGNVSLQIPSARGDLYRELLVRNILHGAPASAMLRRNVVTDVGFFDESLPAIEDYDYWLRVCRRYKVECISQPLVRYNDFRNPAQGPGSDVRRSLNIQANLEARAQLYERHGAQMRQEGVAHLYLIDSAQRHLVPEWNDVKGARRLTARAALLAPFSWEVRSMVARLLKLPQVRDAVKRKRTAFGKAFGAKGIR